jgi:hypothetical protein
MSRRASWDGQAAQAYGFRDGSDLRPPTAWDRLKPSQAGSGLESSACNGHWTLLSNASSELEIGEKMLEFACSSPRRFADRENARLA